MPSCNFFFLMSSGVNFFEMLLFKLKMKFYFYFVLFICRFFKSETSLDFYSFISDIYVETNNFDSYDIIMS